MDRIQHAFETKSGRAALIPFLNAGDPDERTSEHLLLSVLDAGADLIEIGVPYSDPLADGPVIQASAVRSINAGFQLPRAFETIRRLRANTEKPLILFTYVNPVLQYDVHQFFADVAAAGADGVIIPDLPWEESAQARAAADSHEIALIPLVSPNSGEERIERICRSARGFVYCVSSLGVTGERASVSSAVEDLVKKARKYTTLPIAVGFGVSTPGHATHIANFADGVIVGSAFIRRLADTIGEATGGEREDSTVQAVSEFARKLVTAIQ